MRLRLVVVGLVLAAALADGAGQHPLAYYGLVAAVPAAAVGALLALGEILDGSAAEPLDRATAVLSGLALPMLLLATAVRAPLGEGAAPRLGVSALLACLVLFALQAVLSAAAVLGRSTVPVLERQ